MARTLLVDTNRAAQPIYRALCERGDEVWVVGGNPNDVLAKLASNYRLLDYSNTAELAAFIEEKKFDHLVPGCTDVSYKACADVNGARFPGIDPPAVTRGLNDKGEFRRIASALGLPVPRVLALEEARSVGSVIVKPADSFSGRGMSVLHAPRDSELTEAHGVAARVSKSGNVIIEEFVTGQLFSHSAFVRGGSVIVDFVVQEDCVANPFAVDTSRVATGFPPKLLQALRQDVARLAKGLGLVDGLVHTQFITHDDRYWIIEVTRRCPGDLYSLLIELSTGYPYAAAYAAPFVGGSPPPLGPAGSTEWIVRHTLSRSTAGNLWGWQVSGPVEIRLFIPLARAGDSLGAGPAGRAGIAFLRAQSQEEQQTLYQKLLSGSLYSFA